MVKEIQLTQGKVALIDDARFAYLNQFHWSIDSSGYPQRAVKTSKGWRPLRMHRDILNLQAGEMGDHVNGNTLDHRDANLRVCTPTGNARNSGLSKNNKTGYKGVHYNRARSIYQAHITVNRRHIYLGAYQDPADAARAYNAAALHYFGEFARLNVIPDGKGVIASSL